jgi:glycosyltransferase involved in cell wall biosynthesis
MKFVTVVPCYNEEKRLDGDAVLALTRTGGHVLFVNDGSRDGTAALLDSVVGRSGGKAKALHLAKNAGKAEAVRAGLLEAMREGADRVGYFDADLATPASEMLRLFTLLDQPEVQFAMASRVALLGRHIERTPMRHYLGRVFASAASLAITLRVYDTQCGAKALRATPHLKEALSEPFTTRWVFDVELMMRLIKAGVPHSAFVEMPLRAWVDVKGSKLSGDAMVGAAMDLARLAWWFRR